MKKLLTSILATILLAGCPSSTAPVGPAIRYEHDRSNQRLTIVVITYDSEDELNRAHNVWAKSNHLPTDHVRRLGWSGWSKDKPYNCEIHIVKPKNVDDDNTLSLGHEMAHCLYGVYHDGP